MFKKIPEMESFFALKIFLSFKTNGKEKQKKQKK